MFSTRILARKAAANEAGLGTLEGLASGLLGALPHVHGWPLTLGLLLTGCGANVVVDPDEGAGGAGAENGTGAGGAAGADPAYAVPVCTEWCDANAADCEHSTPCMDRCLEQASYLAVCGAEYEAWLRCRVATPSELPDCHPLHGGPACDAEVDALVACVYPAGDCDAQGCDQPGPEDEHAWECTMVCSGVRFVAACGEHFGGDALPWDCECKIDDQTVGTCQIVTPYGLTELGCCSNLFAEGE